MASSAQTTGLVWLFVQAVILTRPIITDGQPYSFLPPADPATKQPKILTEGQIFRAEVGDTVLLPCRVKDLGPMVLIWKNGTRVLTAGHMMIKRDPRLQLHATDLEISNLQVQDGGEYSCEIETDAEYPATIAHRVEVLVPPKLLVDPSDAEITVRSGTTVALRCRASGNPPPNITWRKRNDRLPTGAVVEDEGSTLTMTSVSRHHAGLYECEASNGVGANVSTEMRLKVRYEPEVSAEENVVHGGLTHQAEISCFVYADPEPEVIWYRDTMRLDPNERRYMESRGARHTLIVRSVQKQDFANYSCYASNSLGRNRAYITLRGNPNPPVFSSQVLSKSQTSYKISWVTESFAPIEEYRLLYRKIPSDGSVSSPTVISSSNSNGLSNSGSGSGSSSATAGKRRPSALSDLTHPWHNLRLPPREMLPSGPDGNQYQEAYTLGPLLPDSAYEAKVSAKNKYGWSEPSAVFNFYTQGKGTSPNQNFVKNPKVKNMGLSSKGSVTNANVLSGAMRGSSYGLLIAVVTVLTVFA